MKKPIEIPHYEDQDILSAVEAAQYMKVSKDTVYTLVSEDKIPHRYVGRQVRFPFWLLRSWLEGKAVS